MNVQLERLATALADRYRIERELGAGGMATVYLAHDTKHERDVAIKVLHPDLGAALGGERFLSEIRTTARLQHPHILPLLDSGAAEHLLYYVMPLVTGETLRTRLTRERQLPVNDAVRITREVAAALDYAHRQGVIHRDIKPENILLHDGSALVADFGIALAVQQAGGQRLTQTGLSLGTPQYMSPEQAMGEKSIDARSDIYALGAVAYEMMAGEPPFTGATVQVIVARLMAEEPRSLSVQRRSVPAPVEGAVMRALAKVPADRFATAAEFASALELRETPATQAAATRNAAVHSRRSSYVLGAIAAVSTAAAAWAWTTRPVQSSPTIRYGIVIDSVPAVKDWHGELAISPDGSTIVRSGGPSGALLIRRRDDLGFVPLANTEGASAPFFSHDGNNVAYFANGVVLETPLAGGPATTLVDSLSGVETISWGSDGFLYRALLTDGVTRIVRRKPGSNDPWQTVTNVDTIAGELLHMLASPLPDGKSVLFQSTHKDGKRMIAIGDIGTGRHEELFEGARAKYVDGYLLYTTIDGKLWAVAFDPDTRRTSGTALQVGDRIPNTQVGPVDFAISETGTLVYSVEDSSAHRELTWVTRSGRRERLDSTWNGDFASPVLSPDGSRVAVAIRNGATSDIWIKRIAGGAPSKLTTQHRNNFEPAWSADGRLVSYLAASRNPSSGDVWRQAADGSGRATLVATSARPLSEQIAVPGTDALLLRTTTPTPGAGDILMLRPGIDDQPKPLVASAFAEYTPVVSPNGKWLAYSSNETGTLEVYVTPFGAPGESKRQVSNGGGTTPRWSQRGDELFYIDFRSNMVAARISESPSLSVQETRILFNAADFIQTAVSRRNYDVSPDGQRFLMVQRADGAKRGQVIVVENWLSEMRGRGKTGGIR